LNKEWREEPVPGWKAPDWKKRRDLEILAALREGTPPEALARRYSLPLRAVLGISEGAEMRERFAQEHAESGGRARMRTLGTQTETTADPPQRKAAEMPAAKRRIG
jgi:hypothetical protein